MRKPTFWFPTWSDTNQAVQLQKMDRGLKLRISKVEGLYYPCRENKGADQFGGGYCEAVLRFVFAYAKCWSSHDAAHVFPGNYGMYSVGCHHWDSVCIVFRPTPQHSRQYWSYACPRNDIV